MFVVEHFALRPICHQSMQMLDIAVWAQIIATSSFKQVFE